MVADCEQTRHQVRDKILDKIKSSCQYHETIYNKKQILFLQEHSNQKELVLDGQNIIPQSEQEKSIIDTLTNFFSKTQNKDGIIPIQY